MRRVVAKDRQTLFDIALEVWGRAELAYDLAESNGLELSAEVEAGAVLVVPTVVGKTDAAVVEQYALNGIEPATAASLEELEGLAPEGIGYWYVKEPVPVMIVSPNED